MAENGSDGIPLAGKTEEYATELWLAGPSAFWLHPEGPLSETTPDEYLEKKAEQERQAREALAQHPLAGLQQANLSAYQNYSQAAPYYQHGLHNNAYGQYPYQSLVGLFGFR